MGKVRKYLKRISITLGLITILTVFYIVFFPDPQYQSSSAAAGTETNGDPRLESRTFTSFPEWYIVYAAEEYADFVLSGKMPTDFPWLASTNQYWQVYDDTLSYVGGEDVIDSTTLTVLKTIGYSFAVENWLNGLYENTLGRLTDYLNLRYKSPEDRYVDTVAKNYSNWLNQTPWFAFPYGEATKGLWTSYGLGSITPRGIERRLSFTIGYAYKGLYGRTIEYLTRTSFGGAGQFTTITVSNLDEKALGKIANTGDVKKLENGMLQINLPRYRAFLEPALSILEAGGAFESIQNNQTIMISLLADYPISCPTLMKKETKAYPLITKPDSARYTLVTEVSELNTLVKDLQNCNLSLEHIYDY